MDLPRRAVAPGDVDAAAVVAAGRVPVVVLGGVGFGGFFGVDMVAGQIRSFVGGGHPLVVGGVVQWSA